MVNNLVGNTKLNGTVRKKKDALSAIGTFFSTHVKEGVEEVKEDNKIERMKKNVIDWNREVQENLRKMEVLMNDYKDGGKEEKKIVKKYEKYILEQEALVTEGEKEII